MCKAIDINHSCFYIIVHQMGEPDGACMITAAQMRAARALLGIDQRQLAEFSDVSLPTIQRMEASEGNVRGVVETLTKVIEAFDAAGVELIGENTRSLGDGRGVRFKHPVALNDAVYGQKLLRRRTPYAALAAAKSSKKS
jgi:transcriptional regulator with XRE-family HTH domain